VDETSCEVGKILRHGAKPQWIEIQSSVQKSKDVIPDWATSALPMRPRPLTHLAARENQTTDTVAASRGVAIHRLFEIIGDVAAADRGAVALRQAKRLGLDEADVASLQRFLSTEISLPFFVAGSRGEVDLRGNLPNGEKVNSRVDRLAEAGAVSWLLDYKTGPVQSLDENHAYVKQMAKYAWLLRAAQPGTEVKAALLWTQTGALDWLDAALLSRSFERMMQAPS
jgi:ATP-dependent exoDNAse (exonuclease V) beta subunit